VTQVNEYCCLYLSRCVLRKII